MDNASLLETNRSAFKDIFSRQLINKDLKCITHKHFFEFLCTVKIYPDLISSFDLKKILSTVLKKKLSEKRPGEISYSNFERLLLAISDHCFPSGDSLKFLITHIKNMCHVLFHTTLHTKVNSIHTNQEIPEVVKNNMKVMSRTRISNISSGKRKSLNKSTSQKLSMSGLTSPKTNITTLQKVFEFKSPSLKMLTTRNKVRNRDLDKQMVRVNMIFDKFRQRYETVTSENLGKKQSLYEIDKMMEKKHNNVRNI